MNQQNLKQVLAVVVRNINAKAVVEMEQYTARYEAKREELMDKRKKDEAAAYAKIKAAPIAKVVVIKWSDSPSNGYRPYSTDLTDWAKGVLNKVQADYAAAIEKLQSGSVGIRFDTGPGKDDFIGVYAPKYKQEAYLRLRSKFDQMRIKLLLADNNDAAAAIESFMKMIEGEAW